MSVKMKIIEITKLKITVKMFTVAMLLVSGQIFAQTLINNAGGFIENESTGTIKVKTTGRLLFDKQDTVGGTVIFNAQESGRGQIVPNITYNKLVFNALATLYIDSLEMVHAYTRPMTVLDSFVVLSGDYTKVRNSWIETHSKGNVFNNGAIRGTKDVVMNADTVRQTIDGDNKGSFSRLRIENPQGVEVVGGSFTVTNKLELKVGELDNSNVNFNMGYANSSDRKPNLVQIEHNVELSDGLLLDKMIDEDLERPLIVRHTTGSVRNRPNLLEDSIDIHYVGAGSMHTGMENPDPNQTEKVIHGMRAENTDSLILTENMNVYDNIYVGTHIHTVEEDTLTLASVKNPEFHPNNPEAEVHGNFRRIGWRDGDTIIFNNPMTKLLFRKTVPRNSISQLVSTIYPGRFHQLKEGDKDKVRRQISLRAMNEQYIEYTNEIDAVYGYGWRYQGDHDETLNLAFEKLMLLHYDSVGTRPWVANDSSVVPPQNNSLGKWAYSHTTDIQNFGRYAIGLNILQPYLALRSKAFLEGPYIHQSVKDTVYNRRMTNELQKRNYLPMPPADVYPYNLDPKRDSYVRKNEFGEAIFPDSVVDWVVLEFRKEFSTEGPRKTFLLKTDGRIVDIWGYEIALFDDYGVFADVDSLGNAPHPQDTILDAQMYVLLLHRNHAALISDKPISFAVNETVFVDFTLPSTVLGGTNSLKLIDRDISQTTIRHIYGMIAGDINLDGVIDKKDYDYINIIKSLDDWTVGSGGTIDGYLLRDLNLSGTINTLDFNIGFNNRGRLLWYRP